MKTLYLEDLQGMTKEELVKHICYSYKTTEEALKDYHILVAYESVGSWGCDSSSYFLLKHKKTKEYFEVIGGHCSCYGFEDQWEPTATPVEYLKSDKFRVSLGGYDNCPETNTQAIKDFMKGLK